MLPALSELRRLVESCTTKGILLNGDDEYAPNPPTAHQPPYAPPYAPPIHRASSIRLVFVPLTLARGFLLLPQRH